MSKPIKDKAGPAIKIRRIRGRITKQRNAASTTAARKELTKRAANLKDRGLNPREVAMRERFVLEYLADPKRNQTQAAIRAGYSAKSASILASRLMKDQDVLDAIMAQSQAYARQLEIDGKAILAKLNEIGMAETLPGSHIKPTEQIRALDLLGVNQKLWEGSSGARTIQINITPADEKLL